MIQTVDSAVQGGEGRNFAPGLHQLPVRPVTQNGKHTTAVVATATSFANASGRLFRYLWFTLRVHADENRVIILTWRGEDG